MDQVVLSIPIALQNLIRSNNQLLKNYQEQLLAEVQEANGQMMQLLRLDPQLGWKLDLERMAYVRDKTEEEKINSAQPTE